MQLRELHRARNQCLNLGAVEIRKRVQRDIARGLAGFAAGKNGAIVRAMSPTRADCEALDREDALAHFRDRFALPEGVVYLDGNSLGPLPKAAPVRVAEVVQDEWGHDLIRSWNTHDWIGMSARVGDKIGRLIGAGPDETIAADSTSINLYKALSAALALRPERRTILSERGNFPTDLYMAQGLVAQLGNGYRLALVAPDAVANAIDCDTAAVLLTHVHYVTGRVHDMAAVTAAAHAKGALTIWDLCHTAGAMPVDLNAARADFAVGCGYKWLNGGPGAPAFLYVAKRHQGAARPALSGWLGHADPFAFAQDYAPAPGIGRFVVGTPPILSLAALEVGVDLMLEASLPALYDKAMRQFDLFRSLMDKRLAGRGFALVSVAGPGGRGSEIGYAHEEGWPIMRALIARGIIGDFRAPNVLRFGIAPLYQRYTEIWDAVEGLRAIMDERLWDRAEYRARPIVT